MRRFLMVACTALIAVTAHAQVVVRGNVTDASTGMYLRNVHILHGESGRGAITNEDGVFEIAVPSLPTLITVRHVGYTTRVLGVPRDGPLVRVQLEPSVLSLDELVVAGDELAPNVMRKVIARKRAARRKVNAFASRVYTRTTLEDVAGSGGGPGSLSIRESVYDRYYRRDGGIREVLLSYRESDDAYALFEIPPFGYRQDFYDDEIEIAGLTFVGPTHRSALEVYTFSFAGVRAIDGQRIYDIYVAPRSDALISLVGTVSVLAEENVMIESYLRPARHVAPASPRTRWDVHYQQSFMPVSDSDSALWAPISLTALGRVSVADNAREEFTARIKQVTVFSNYEVNVGTPARWYATRQRTRVDSATVFADYLFTLGSNVVPLTPREAERYELARSGARRPRFRAPAQRNALSLFAPRISEPDGPRFAWPTVYGYRPLFRYNRVDGLLSGVGQIGRPRPGSTIEWHLAQATGWRRVRYLLRFEQEVGSGIAVGGKLQKDALPNQVFSRVGLSTASLAALADQGDYFDYHASIRKSLLVRWMRGPTRASAALRYNKLDSLSVAVSSLWPYGRNARDNPSIEPIRTGELKLNIALGDYRNPYSRRTPTRVELETLASPAGLLDSGGYWLANLEASTSMTTFLRSRRHPPHLDLIVRAGLTRGSSPYTWSLDTSAGGFANFGSLRSHSNTPAPAQDGAMLFWRHDFGRALFDVLGVDRARVLGATVNLHGASGFLDATWHHEFGVGVSDLFGLPFDVTATRNHSALRWHIGFSIRQ